MKYKIKYSNGRWSVIEPSGEVRWHFDTWAEAGEYLRQLKEAGK